MKKLYCKPEIQFESFALSVDIAAGCERIIDTHRGGQCALYVVGLGNVFTHSASDCDVGVVDDGRFSDGYCYHVPTADKNLFNS